MTAGFGRPDAPGHDEAGAPGVPAGGSVPVADAARSAEPVADGGATLPRTEGVRLFAGVRIVAACTLLSRILGLARDAGMAVLFGNGAVLDAFTVAFRIPNLFRLLFGEGALTTAFLPAFVGELERSGKPAAWRFATAALCVLGSVLAGIVLLLELALAGALLLCADKPDVALLLRLTAILLPYLVLVCLAALVGAVLHAFGRFTVPALLPALLNAIWLSAVGLVPLVVSSDVGRVQTIAACIALAGIVQVAALVPTLRALGFRFAPDWRAARAHVAAVAKTMVPVLVGLSVTQFNTLVDSLLAWALAAPETLPGAAAVGVAPGIPWLARTGLPVLEPGTAAALYLGQRLYQFPLGVFGIALGTVMFPLLARHAGQGRLDRLRDDLGLGLRLVLGIGVPAGAGLVLLSEPLVDLLFRRGAFDADDARQTARMIAAYGSGVWAYCGLMIVHRGFYAVGDRATPLRVGLLAVALNATTNLILLNVAGGAGLAWSTAFSATVQVLLAGWLLDRRTGPLPWRSVGGFAIRTLVATAVMTAACRAAAAWFPPGESTTARALAVLVPLGAGLAAYFVAAVVLRMDDLWRLVRRDEAHRDASDAPGS